MENTLKCIDGVVSRLGNGSQYIVDGVHDNIKACRQELQELNLLISNLTSDKNAKASEKRVKAAKRPLYPFKRDKLVELEERVGKATSGLQLAL